jgi:hypothetical protein
MLKKLLELCILFGLLTGILIPIVSVAVALLMQIFTIGIVIVAAIFPWVVLVGVFIYLVWTSFSGKKEYIMK